MKLTMTAAIQARWAHRVDGLIHSHAWTVEATVEGPADADKVIPADDLERILHDHVQPWVGHYLTNEDVGNWQAYTPVVWDREPTVEEIVRHLWRELEAECRRPCRGRPSRVHRVRPLTHRPPTGVNDGRSVNMGETRRTVVVGIDVGGSKTNATVVDLTGAFLVDRMADVPSLVSDGPEAALDAIVEAMNVALVAGGVPDATVLAVGLDTPGPASATGVISSKGSTNFQQPAWRGYDVRAATEARLGVPVLYHNDGNAATLYAHEHLFGPDSPHRSSVAAIVGTGLGGGVVERGHIVRGASGMAGEFGHVPIPMDGLLELDQPLPQCNCGLVADLESIASLSGIERNLLPYWLSRYPGHPLGKLAARSPARRPERSAATAKAVTSWPCGSSASRRRQSVGCSRSPPTTPTPTPISWAEVSSSRSPRFATGSSRRSGRPPRCARSSGRWPSSPSSPISTWPAPGVRRSPPSGQFTPNCRNVWAVAAPVLLLDAAWRIDRVIDAERACELLVMNRVVAASEEIATVMHSPSLTVEIPSVVARLGVLHPCELRPPSYSPRRVRLRDGHLCQFVIGGQPCSRRGDSVDHLLPRSLGGDDSWLNVVAACRAHNGTKSHRTLEQMLHLYGWSLKRAPFIPSRTALVAAALRDRHPAWEPFLSAA